MSRPALTAPHALPQRSPTPAKHQYACLRCRSRRVKCDKMLLGCANCASHEAQCVYSSRRPRKPQKSPHDQATIQRPLLPALGPPPGLYASNSIRADTSRPDWSSDPASAASEQSDEECDEAVLLRELSYSSFNARNDATNSHRGRLFVGPQGKFRYINGDKVKQVVYLESVLLSGSMECHESVKPVSLNQSENPNATSLLTTSQNGTRDLPKCQPPTGIMHVLWDYYCRNVDVMVKVLYKPAVEPVVMRASNDLHSIDSTTEAPLLFAIWLAAATSMSAEECRRLHNAERGPLVRKYRCALEQSLSEAGWMTTQDILVLQSVAIYLVFASPNSRSTWILNGIALSLAQAMGMHSDSSSFSLNPIETETRRRIWWMLCQTDVRVSENCGLQSHVPHIMDTELPMNINDSDIDLASRKVLSSRKDFTEMTVSLIKAEMTKTTLEFKRSSSSREEREKIVRDQLQRYEDISLKYYDGQAGLDRLYYLGTRLIMARLWRMMHDATDLVLDDESLEEPLMLWNADVLEIAHQLPSRYQQYGWFFRPAVDRAWEVLDAAFADWHQDLVIRNVEDVARPRKTIKALWYPLSRLHERAQEVRRQALDSQPSLTSANIPSTLSMGYETGSLHSNSTPHEFPPPIQLEDGPACDPFFGPAEDLNMEMNWTQLDDWVQSFQESFDHQTMDFKERMCWEL